LSAEVAARKIVSGAHSIWELVCHITAWERAAIKGLAGEGVDLPDDKDWPTVVDEGGAAWKKALQDMRDTNEELRRVVSQLDDARLEETVAGKDYSVSVMLHGVVQHSLYHAGQIALLRKS
jgi:uncharacterized damage-inducible protein DinB